jgi:hypothetical protein
MRPCTNKSSVRHVSSSNCTRLPAAVLDVDGRIAQAATAKGRSPRIGGHGRSGIDRRLTRRPTGLSVSDSRATAGLARRPTSNRLTPRSAPSPSRMRLLRHCQLLQRAPPGSIVRSDL